MHMAQRPSFKGAVCFARFFLACMLFLVAGQRSTAAPAESRTTHHELLNPQGSVEVLRKGGNAWIRATTNLFLFAGDAVRTGPPSRAAGRLSNDSVIRLDQLTVMRFPEPTTPRRRFL